MTEATRERRRYRRRRREIEAEQRISSAIYDPARDGPVRYSDPAAQLMGDPPIGRRAIDQRET